MIGSTLNLKQLEALVWVAEMGSFRKAAKHLNTTQPNISSRISGLENSLGLVLMLRDAGSITLTDKGQEILLAANKVLREAEQIVEIAQRQDLFTDRLRLGVTELVACTWLHSYLRKIKAIYPGLNVELTVELSKNLDVELSSNRLDLAIQTSPFNSAATGTMELGKFPYIWVAAPEIAANLPGKCGLSNILSQSVLTHARHTQAYSQLIERIEKSSLSKSQIISSNSLASCVQMAVDGMGVTLLPIALVEKELEFGRLCEVDVDWKPTPLRFAARYQTEKAAPYLVRSAELAVEAVTEFKKIDD